MSCVKGGDKKNIGMSGRSSQVILAVFLWAVLCS